MEIEDKLIIFEHIHLLNLRVIIFAAYLIDLYLFIISLFPHILWISENIEMINFKCYIFMITLFYTKSNIRHA